MSRRSTVNAPLSGLLVLAAALLLVEFAESSPPRALLAVARDENMHMHHVGKDVTGSPCHIDVAFQGNSKYRPCQDLEVIAEAIEVIYAFAVDLEPSEVAVSRVGCNKEGITVSIGFASRVANATLATLTKDGPPPLMAGTLEPFGLELKSTTIFKDML